MRSSYLKSLFFGFLLVTVLVYILRGMGILSFLPGGLILLLILSSVVTGIIYGIDQFVSNPTEKNISCISYFCYEMQPLPKANT